MISERAAKHKTQWLPLISNQFIKQLITHDGFCILLGGALGDRALPEAHGKINVLYFVHGANHGHCKAEKVNTHLNANAMVGRDLRARRKTS